jgi:DNA invertase Pin-like site-specific DNA recombinase
MIRERTQAGLRAARARGRKGGHPRVKSLADPKQLALAKRLYAAKDTTVEELCRMFKVSRATFYRYMNDGTSTTKNMAASLGEEVRDR